MERKNMVLLTVIAVATLLVAVVGATFAYFTATVTDSRDEGSGKGETQLNTATLADTITVANIDSAAGKFTATDVYPGHMEVAGMKVSITAESGTFAIPFEYKVTNNTISANGGTINYYLYKDEEASIDDFTSDKLGCSLKTTDGESNEVRYSETCTFVNATSKDQSPTGVPTLTSLKLVANGSLQKNGGSETIDMIDHVEVTTSKDVNYYFVVEYKDTGDDQSSAGQEGQSLSGTITVAGAKAAVTP